MIRNPTLDPTRDHPGEWAIEPEQAALARTPAIGRVFFERLPAAYPQVVDALVFLRWQGQADDVYAVYDAEPGFRVQIDPHLDYIIIWDGVTQGEYAEWGPGDDPVAEALKHISDSLGPPAKQ